MIWLKQSTAVTVILGPFLDATDGVTPKTALSLVQADIRVSKNGGTFAQKSDATGGTHRENGEYAVAFDTTDTGTLGYWRADVFKATACPVWQEGMVLPANVWDSLFGADRLQVDVEEIGANMITNTVIATDAISSAQLASAAATEIANAVKAVVVETQGSYTLQQALSIMLAVLAGRTSSSGATMSTPDGAATRVAATIDGSNNRTSMALTPSA